MSLFCIGTNGGGHAKNSGQEVRNRRRDVKTPNSIRKKTAPDNAVLMERVVNNDVILNNLFNCVDYQTLKDCRFVCKKWHRICNPVFTKRSIVLFDGSSNNILPFSEDAPQLHSIFKGIAAEQEVRFGAFRLEMNFLTAPVVEACIKSFRSTMHHLEIFYEDRHSTTTIDRNYSMDHLLHPNLRKLTLESATGRLAATTWIVSLEKLVGIHYIDLTDCTLVVNTPRLKIKPKELTIIQCKRKLNGRITLGTHLNEIVDFKFLRILCLIGPLATVMKNLPTKITLDLSDCVNVKTLTLRGITINLNAKIFAEEVVLEKNQYRERGLIVKKFSLQKYLATTTTITTLVIQDDAVIFDFDPVSSEEELQKVYATKPNVKSLQMGIFSFYTLDVYYLPKTIENLHVTNKMFIITCSQPVCFPILTQLILTEYASALSHFQNCPALNDVALDGVNYSDSIIRTDTMPQNITRLTLRNINEIEIVGTKIYQLETLVISLCKLGWENDVVYFSTKLKAKLLIVHLCVDSGIMGLEIRFTKEGVDKIMKMKDKLRQKSIAFGPVSWQSLEEFESSEFCDIVDKMGKFYIVEGSKGRAISKTEFNELMLFEDDRVFHNDV